MGTGESRESPAELRHCLLRDSWQAARGKRCFQFGRSDLEGKGDAAAKGLPIQCELVASDLSSRRTAHGVKSGSSDTHCMIPRLHPATDSPASRDSYPPQCT